MEMIACFAIKTKTYLPFPTRYLRSKRRSSRTHTHQRRHMLSIIMIVLTKLRHRGNHMIRVQIQQSLLTWHSLNTLIDWSRSCIIFIFIPLTFASYLLVSTQSAIVEAILSKDYKYLDCSHIVYMFVGFSYSNLFLNVQFLLRNQPKPTNIININKHDKFIHNLSFLPL